MLEQFACFAREMPAWCGVDGFPLSWRHFRAGMSHIERAHAQEELRMTNAARLGQSDKEPFVDYTNRLRTVGGLTRS
jgi:hypothetical protein